MCEVERFGRCCWRCVVRFDRWNEKLEFDDNWAGGFSVRKVERVTSTGCLCLLHKKLRIEKSGS